MKVVKFYVFLWREGKQTYTVCHNSYSSLKKKKKPWKLLDFHLVWSFTSTWAHIDYIILSDTKSMFRGT